LYLFIYLSYFSIPDSDTGFAGIAKKSNMPLTSSIQVLRTC